MPSAFTLHCASVLPRMRLASLLAVVGTLVATCLLAEATVAQAASPEPSAEGIAFFESKVRPIFVEHCHKCHAGKEHKGEFKLDSHAATMQGGESGAVIVAGKPEASLLIEAVRYESLEMPPSGKLADDQIAILTEWVKIGAPYPPDAEGVGPALRAKRHEITDEDRNYWAFQPVAKVAPPTISGDTWSRGAIDRFLLATMQTQELQPAPEADRATLLRRVKFDLTGLPPTAEELAEFLADERDDAYEQLVDRLLASRAYGERWARHWLDLVRYAESDGYKQDAYRPTSWRYRDYVIDAFNNDKPYREFIIQQLAGDELRPVTAENLAATGYLRLGVYEYNQRDIKTQWSIILNDLTDVTADVFLGMGMQCARCHDHKFDPILQQDYFRLQAFFTPLGWRDETPLADQNEQQALAHWQAATAEIRSQIEAIERPHYDAAARSQLSRFPEDTKPFLFKSPTDRTPYEQQLYELAVRQAADDMKKVDFSKKLSGEVLERWTLLKKQLADLEHLRPQNVPMMATATDIGPVAPPTMIPGKRNADEVLPGPPTVLVSADASASAAMSVVPPAPVDRASTGRRLALAQWIASPDHPLTARVMVNRVWQYHFGRGLVESSSDFGRLGQPPTHPELLDWLAAEFIANDFRLKPLHRLMVTSAAYKQASRGSEIEPSITRDPANRFLSRMSVRRLEAEQIRDAALAVSGELDPRVGGDAVEPTEPRRSVYVKVFRNKRDPLLEVFDVPDGIGSAPVRNVTTTANQSLLLINGPWLRERAKVLAHKIAAEVGNDRKIQTREAYRRILSREPTDAEMQFATDFFGAVAKDAKLPYTEFCHVLMNSSEFLYVD